MVRGSRTCIGDRDQEHLQETEMQKSKWLSEEALQTAEKRREVRRKRRKEYIFPFECRVPKNSKERLESLPQ